MSTTTVVGAGRGLRVLGLLLGGFALGTVGAFVQAVRGSVGPVPVPWGAALVLLTLVLLVRGGSWLVGTRWGGVAVLVGWLGATLALAVSSPSGDVAITDGGRQLGYLALGVLLGTAAATVPLVDR